MPARKAESVARFGSVEPLPLRIFLVKRIECLLFGIRADSHLGSGSSSYIIVVKKGACAEKVADLAAARGAPSIDVLLAVSHARLESSLHLGRERLEM